MNIRLLSALLVFLLIASVSIPSVSAEPSQVYYELHNLCLCKESKDLGHVPYLNWGIGYKAWIDKQTDNWNIFVHAGKLAKEFTITPETNLGKLVTLIDFVNNTDECKEESDQIPFGIMAAIGAGTVGSAKLIKGALTDDALSEILGTAGITASAEIIHQSVIHFNNAKNAQKNAEKLFEEL